jgi:hypothetical protein
MMRHHAYTPAAFRRDGCRRRLRASGPAWNKPNHEVIGAIAYAVLKQDSPETIARVVEILKHHPEYATFAKRLETVPAEDRDRYLFMQAARWPDDVRDNKQHHHGEWHYINLPITSKAWDEIKVTSEPLNVVAALGYPNILSALSDNAKVMKAGTDAERAVAACWLLHLVGDVHQPLYAVAYHDDEHRRGDRGGNDFYVRVTAGGAVINLQSLWDGLLGNDQKYRATGDLAIGLRNRPEFAREMLKNELAVPPAINTGNSAADAWCEESAAIARDVAYAGGALRGGTNRNDGPVLPDGYTKRAKAVAERRVVLAGYRLAEVLKSVTKGRGGKVGKFQPLQRRIADAAASRPVNATPATASLTVKDVPPGRRRTASKRHRLPGQRRAVKTKAP